jgi:DNA-binding GntR family transcriptional regulator
LLAPGSDWRQLWRRRAPLYRELAQETVSTHPESVEESLERLAAIAGGDRESDAG